MIDWKVDYVYCFKLKPGIFISYTKWYTRLRTYSNNQTLNHRSKSYSNVAGLIKFMEKINEQGD